MKDGRERNKAMMERVRHAMESMAVARPWLSGWSYDD